MIMTPDFYATMMRTQALTEDAYAEACARQRASEQELRDFENNPCKIDINCLTEAASIPIIGVIPSIGFLLYGLAKLVANACLIAFRNLRLFVTSDAATRHEIQDLLNQDVKDLKGAAHASRLFALQVVSLGFFVTCSED